MDSAIGSRVYFVPLFRNPRPELRLKSLFALSLLLLLAGSGLSCDRTGGVAEPVEDAPATPTSVAGDDQTVPVGVSVQLDGGASSHPAGKTLTYAWSFDSRPEGSGAGITDSRRVRANFVPDVAGSYGIRLTVSAEGRSASSVVTIEAEG